MSLLTGNVERWKDNKEEVKHRGQSSAEGVQHSKRKFRQEIDI